MVFLLMKWDLEKRFKRYLCYHIYLSGRSVGAKYLFLQTYIVGVTGINPVVSTFLLLTQSNLEIKYLLHIFQLPVVIIIPLILIFYRKISDHSWSLFLSVHYQTGAWNWKNGTGELRLSVHFVCGFHEHIVWMFEYAYFGYM